MKIKFAFWRRLKARRELARLLPELIRELEHSLNQIVFAAASANSIAALVKFFTITSPWHDRGFEWEITLAEKADLPKLAEHLLWLEQCFREAGRSKFGLNQTERGEAVTANKVFIGGFHRTPVLTVQYCLKRRSRLMVEMPPSEDTSASGEMSTWDILSWQASSFMRGWTRALHDRVEKVRQEARSLL